jgi:tetratricopeptide (TPR) repeat protein
LAKLTRKELKTDKFAEEVTHSLAFLSGHRRQAILYGAGGLVLVLLIAGIFFYRRNAAQDRQAALTAALRISSASIGTPSGPDDVRVMFPTQAAKEEAERKAFQELSAKYPSSNEAAVAEYQIGVLDANAGNLDAAAKHFQAAITYGDTEYSAIAKLSLAQVYVGQGKTGEVETLLRDLIAHPTLLVSKEQATLMLAKAISDSKPEEARNLLEPLEKDTRTTISQNAAELLAALPPKTVPAKQTN